MDKRYIRGQYTAAWEEFPEEDLEEEDLLGDEELNSEELEGIDPANSLGSPPEQSFPPAPPLLTRQQEISLAKRIEQGDAQARHRLIEANYRLVFSVVNKYRNSGVPFEDLVQEGYIGLIQAVDRYDHRRACRFSTCATIWIRAHILQAIQRFKPLVHVPQRVANTAKKLWRTAEQMAQELQRWPNLQELATQMNLSVEQVEELLGLAQEWISLDEPMGEEGETLLVEMIADEDTRHPDEIAIDSGLREHVERSLKLLPARERKVIQMRFGLNGQREHTLAEIGQHFHLTRQRIKEIETSALDKLRCLDCPQRGRQN